MSLREAPRSWREAVAATLEAREGSRRLQGAELQIRCLSPGHEDWTPSASWNIDEGTGHCHACGESWSTKDAAALLGVELPPGNRPPDPAGDRATRARSDAKRRARQEQAAREAVEQWARSVPAEPGHPYLIRKGVQPHGLRQDGEELLVPAFDTEKELWGIERIFPTGKKLFLTGMAKKSHYCPFGGPPTDHLVIAEGWATAASIHEATGLPVACAFDAGNLRPVAEALRQKLGTQTRIILAADDDRGEGTNTGIEAATAAARAVGGLVAVPEGLDAKGDFNDLGQKLGAEAVRRCIEAATEPAPGADPECEVEGELSLEDFYYVCPQARYIYRRCRELWPAGSVSARVPAVTTADGKLLSSASWIAQHRPVEQLTWAPGEGETVAGRYIAEGGWFEQPGAAVYNLYRPPRIEHGNPDAAGPWLEHVRRIYPEDAQHILRWLAHRVQHPGKKINHALVLGGAQGIGKDTLLEPVRRAVGPWNVSEVSPMVLLGRFNGYLQSVILRVSEARDLGDVNRFVLYDHMKAITAAPPDVLRIDRKNLQEYTVPNVVGVVITTNHRTDGLYLPADDRRHYVAWSDRVKEDIGESYWTELWSWYEAGGYRHVAALLAGYDLSDFRPMAPPPKTAAFHAIVDAGRSPEEGELADALEELGWPEAVHYDQILPRVPGEFRAWLQDRKNSRIVPHRFEAVGYIAVRNPYAKDGRWKVAGSKRVIYTRQELTLRDQIVAARNLAGEPPEDPEPGRGGREGLDPLSTLASPSTPSTLDNGDSGKGERARREGTKSSPSGPSSPEGGYQALFRSKAEPGLDDGDPIVASEPLSAIEVVREVFAGYIEAEEVA